MNAQRRLLTRRSFCTGAVLAGLGGLVGAAGLATSAPASAVGQRDFPTKLVRIIVPFSAGGIVDSIARTVAEQLATRYGQPVIVENRTGAGGSIGTDFVAKAPADGYTLLAVSPSHAVLPSLQKGLAWDPVRDFRAIAGIGFVPNLIVVNAGLPAKTMTEFIALAKQSDPPLTYATAGPGTSNHLSGELLAQKAGIPLTQIPYRGQTDALGDVLTGRVDMMPMTALLALPHVKAGKLRTLAVTTASRAAAAPDLATVAESAMLPDYEVATWFGLAAPTRTPDPVVQKLATDVQQILAQPDVRARLEGLGMELAPQMGADFDALIAREVSKWGTVMKRAGVQPN